MVTLKEKIKAALDNSQGLMEDNVHLRDYLTVAHAIDEVKKYYSALTEEDREYVESCKYALNEQLPWKMEK